MPYDALRAAYDEDGFVVIRSFLPPDELRRLQDNVDRYVREVVPGLPPSDAFFDDRARPETLKQLNRMQQDAFFQDYLREPRWVTLAESLLGEPAWSHGAEWFNKPPATVHPTPPHQDNFYFCLSPPQVLTMWLALDEVDEENGCLRYIGGSHRRGIRPHRRTQTLGFSQGISDFGDADRARETAMRASPGDLLVHHGNTIHRAEANRSAHRHRRSFAMVFRTDSAVRDEEAFQRYLRAVQEQHHELGAATPK